jgi:hypothetical protein
MMSDVRSKMDQETRWLPRNQAGDAIFYSPIITGLKKTDKLCFMPHNFYHAKQVIDGCWESSN